MNTRNASKTSKTSAPAKTAKDDLKVTSSELVFTLMNDEATYEARVLTMAPVLASRVAGGESQADIARGLTALAKAQGRVLTLAAAKMRVSRYVAIGQKITSAPKDANLSDVVAKASAAVRGTKPKGAKPEGNKAKTNDEKAAIVADTLGKIIAKADRAELEKIDGLVTAIADMVAARYAELDTAEKVA